MSRKFNIDAGLIVQEVCLLFDYFVELYLVLTEPQVSEGSAAEKIGIRNGDIIESLNGECIPTVVEVGCTADVLCFFNLS